MPCFSPCIFRKICYYLTNQQVLLLEAIFLILKRLRVNNYIRIPEVQVIDEVGKPLGVMRTPEALALAQSKGLDLVEVNPSVNPSMTKIMDYGKYLYKKAKSDRKQKSKQKTSELKSIRFAYRTGQHDLEVKTKKIDKFLEKGNKVRVDMIIRGREKAHPDVAREKLNKFLGLITVEYKVEQEPKKTPRGLVLTISKT